LRLNLLPRHRFATGALFYIIGPDLINPRLKPRLSQDVLNLWLAILNKKRVKPTAAVPIKFFIWLIFFVPHTIYHIKCIAPISYPRASCALLNPSSEITAKDITNQPQIRRSRAAVKLKRAWEPIEGTMPPVALRTGPVEPSHWILHFRYQSNTNPG
jgi:hypothetical protein